MATDRREQPIVDYLEATYGKLSSAKKAYLRQVLALNPDTPAFDIMNRVEAHWQEQASSKPIWIRKSSRPWP